MSKQVGSIQRPGWKRSSVKHLSPGSDVVSLVVLSNSSPINVLISSGEQKALRPLLKCRMMYLIRFMYELNSSFCDLTKKNQHQKLKQKIVGELVKVLYFFKREKIYLLDWTRDPGK